MFLRKELRAHLSHCADRVSLTLLQEGDYLHLLGRKYFLSMEITWAFYDIMQTMKLPLKVSENKVIVD